MAALIRQSCDRCHNQKLRCTRPDVAGTAACSRCLRKRVPCNYSFSLPKGRPKVYHSAQQTRSTRAAAPTTNSLPAGPALDFSSGSGSGSGSDSGIEAGAMATHVAHSTNAGSHSHAPDSMMPDLPDPGPPAQPMGDPPTDLYMETRPWPDAPAAPLRDEYEIPWSDTGSLADNRHGHEPGRPSRGVDTSCPFMFPGLSEWSAIGDGGGGDGAFDPPSPPTTRDSFDSPLGGYRPNHPLPRFGSSNTSKFADRDHRGSDSASEEAVVAQLSRMSIRLSRLRGLCDAFSATAGAKRHSFSSRAGRGPGNRSFIDDATFESVASWLLLDTATTTATVDRDMHFAPTQAPKTTGSALSHLFSESHTLLKILRDMQADTGSRSSIFPSHMATAGDHTVTRHLVMACHMMLLGIYKMALEMLERKARESREAEAGALGDIRLASTVQLCCYLTRHHDKAIDRFVSDQNYNDGPNSQGFPDVATREELAKVKVDIQDTIVRLNETLS